MILQGTTPRALSGPGFLALALMAALMLPLLPTWAQEPPAPPKPPVPAEDKIRVLVEDFLLEDMTAFQMVQLLLQLQAQKEAGQDTKEIDRVIAELKKKLAELEAKRAGEKAKATVEDKKKAAEIEKARAEVNAAQERLHAAMERLAQLEGGKRRVIIAVERAAVPLKVEARTYELRKAAADALRNVQPQSNEERLKALEKNLADLLKEVQGLRKEMKKPGEPSGALDPKSPLSIRVLRPDRFAGRSRVP